jgi:hypothetical protein
MKRQITKHRLYYDARTSALTFSPSHLSIAADNHAYINRGETFDTTLTSLRDHLRLRLEIDFDDLLAQNGQIAVIWDVEDVLESRPDLTREQAWEVLQTAKQNHDAQLGINWSTLHSTAFDLFGNAPGNDDPT